MTIFEVDTPLIEFTPEGKRLWEELERIWRLTDLAMQAAFARE